MRMNATPIAELLHSQMMPVEKLAAWYLWQEEAASSECRRTIEYRDLGAVLRGSARAARRCVKELLWWGVLRKADDAADADEAIEVEILNPANVLPLWRAMEGGQQHPLIENTAGPHEGTMPSAAASNARISELLLGCSGRRRGWPNFVEFVAIRRLQAQRGYSQQSIDSCVSMLLSQGSGESLLRRVCGKVSWLVETGQLDLKPAYSEGVVGLGV
jgi:hypothetical protein